jgi:transcriptional regulator with XRE-family HTH domain
MPESDPLSFRSQLFQWLTGAGINQAELARRTELSTSAVSRIVSGIQVPSAQTCRSIAAALNLPPSRVMVAAGHLRESDLENSGASPLPPQAQVLFDLGLSQEEWRKVTEFAVFIRTHGRGQQRAARAVRRQHVSRAAE